jgi:LuxR family maltose regulon positive regulatory protein
MWPELERWLRMLPADILQRRPSMLLQRVRIVRMRDGMFEGMRHLFRDIRAIVASSGFELDPAEAESLASEIALYEISTLPLENHVEEYLSIASHALECLAPHQRFARGRALYWYGIAQQASNRADEGIHRLNLELSRDAGRVDACTVHALLGLAVIYLREGNLSEVARIAEYMLQLAVDFDLAETQGWARLMLGIVAFERNELDLSVAYLSAIRGQRRAETGLCLYESMLWLALAYRAKGMENELEEVLERLVELALLSKTLEYLPMLRAFQARLSLLSGDEAEAIRWLDAVPRAIDTHTLMAAEVPLLTRVKVLIAAGSIANFDEAASLLDMLIDRAQATNERRRLVECIALRALLYEAQGNRAEANRTLVRALELAAPLGVVRTLLDLGPSLATLLRALSVKDELSRYVGDLLAAFGRTKPKQTSQPGWSRFQIYEVLTEREAEVLNQLGRRKTNQEIADELFISPLTVKRHASNIYQKLGVSSRRQALIKADQMGLFPEEDEARTNRRVN